MALACPSALEPFGDQTPGCEPHWYQGYPTPYYGQSHVEFRQKCRAFLEEEIRPHLDDWLEQRCPYPLELHAKSLAAGLPTAGLAKDVQGLYPKEMLPDGGFDAFHELIYLDEMCAAGPGGVLGQLSINSMAFPPILSAGSKHIQDMVVPDVIAGHKNISLAISEPTAGSDVSAIRMTAEQQGEEFVVNGQKKWITGGHIADFFTLVARTGKAGPGGISLLLVDAKSPGIKVRKMETQFDTTHGTTFITFDNVKVPAANVVGELGKGFKYILLNFNHERFVIAVQACRLARICYSDSLKYAIKRKTFGKALVEHQMIRWKLAEMSRLVAALQDTNERIAFQYKAGVPDSQLGSQCALLKVQASKTVEFCAREASQIFGGSSIVKEGLGRVVERIYREVRAIAIPGGSEEILLDLAARQAIAGAAQHSKL
jgi:alkylation response protein AidB-like acyl-CoA dehydrogenase